MSIIYKIFGEILSAIYNFTGNFGWAIIIFTVLVRVCLLPLTVKQQKSMENMQKVQPELEKIQKKYQYDKEKLNEETMKLYQKYNVNPMGGCLPLFIQMPILLIIYGVIMNPITYVLKQTPSVEVLTALCQKPSNTQLDVVCFVTNHFEKAAEALKNANLTFNLEALKMNFDFLGLNLGYTPQANNGDYILWLLPILSVVTSFMVNKLSQPKNTDKNGSEQQNQMQTMQYIFPFMTGYFCYILPGAMGLYWITGNILQMLQTLFLRALKSKSNDDVLVIEPKNETVHPDQKKKKKKK